MQHALAGVDDAAYRAFLRLGERRGRDAPSVIEIGSTTHLHASKRAPALLLPTAPVKVRHHVQLGRV